MPGRLRKFGAPFLGAPAPGWLGSAALVDSLGGLPDGGATAGQCWVGCLTTRGGPGVGANGFNRPVLKHGPRSLTCVRVLRVAKTPDAQ